MLYIVAIWAMKHGRQGPDRVRDMEFHVVTDEGMADFMRKVNNSNLYYTLVAC